MNLTTPQFIANLTLTLLLMLSASSAHAVAFCALRDPVNTIYALFPEATSYRSSVKTVGRDARQAALDELPFSIHFNELGRHTLYVALIDEQPIGLVHARSEQGDWGITEYAWAITPDMKIKGVKVQRSRDPLIRNSVDEMSLVVLGKNLADLTRDYPGQAEDNSSQLGLIGSAMKTLAITQIVWRDEVARLEPMAVSRTSFPTAAAVKPIPTVYDTLVLERLASFDMVRSPSFDRSQIVAYRVESRTGEPLGIMVQTPFNLESPERTLWWAVATDGEILGVTNHQMRQPDKDFQEVTGFAPHSPRDCSSLADLAALEIATLARRHSGG